jgi:hypothetical protein
VDAEALKRAAAAAFDGLAPPAHDSVVAHDCDECFDLRDLIAGRTIEALDPETREAIRWDLPLLSDEAKRYYLPVWLHGAIDDPRGDFAAALLFALDSDHRWSPEGGYSDEQRAVITRFLEFMIDHAEGSDAYALERAIGRWTGERGSGA